MSDCVKREGDRAYEVFIVTESEKLIESLAVRLASKGVFVSVKGMQTGPKSACTLMLLQTTKPGTVTPGVPAAAAMFDLISELVPAAEVLGLSVQGPGDEPGMLCIKHGLCSQKVPT